MNTHPVVHVTGVPGPVLLFSHGCFKALLVNRQSLVTSVFLRQLDWEAVSIVELEGRLPVDLVGTVLLGFSDHVVQEVQTTVQGCTEAVFFGLDDGSNVVGILQDIWVVVLHDLANRWDHLSQEWLVDAQLLAGNHGPPEQTPDDIAPTHVGWQGTVTDGKGDCPDVVGDDLELDIVFLIYAVLLCSAELFGLLDQRHEEVGFKVGWGVFKDGNHPFEPHPGINVLVRQRLVSILRGVVELTEDDVPDFQVAFVFSTRVVLRIVVSQVVEFLTTVIEDFGIRTGWTLTNVPEVILVRDQVVLSNPDFTPLIVSVVVLGVVGDVEPLGVKIEPLVAGQQFPGPRNNLVLEVVTNGEVPQHFKHGVVPGSLPNVFNIVGPNTLL